MIAGVWESFPVPARGQEWLAPRGLRGWVLFGLWGLRAVSEAWQTLKYRAWSSETSQGLRSRNLKERDCGIRSETLSLLGGWNGERGRWVVEPR